MPFETHVAAAAPHSHKADLLALVVREGAVGYDKNPDAVPKINDANLQQLDEALGGLLGRAAVEEEFSGKDAQLLTLHTHGKIGPARLIVIGAGKKKDADRDRDG